MAIYDPKIALSSTDREALLLLAELVLASANDDARGNVGPRTAPLSISQANRLLDLLEEFVHSKKFIEGSYFAEGVANGEAWNDRRLKEIYLSWRTRMGFTRVASTFAWNEFVLRAGFKAGPNSSIDLRVGRSPRPMDYDYFIAMENRLSQVAGLHPRVARLIDEFLQSKRPQLESLRARRTKLPGGIIRSFASEFVGELGRAVKGNEHNIMSCRRLVAMTTIIMDAGTLFITRDWTAAGTMSLVGSVLPDLVE